MDKRHQPTGRQFWEKYVVLSTSLKRGKTNTLVINLGGDDPYLLTLPEAKIFAKKAAKKKGFNRLIKVEENVRVYGQNNLAERKYYFKKIDNGEMKMHDRFDEEASMQLIPPKKIKASIIFNSKPRQWGLRGDILLWEDLKKEFESIELPCSKEYFTKVFEEKFEKLTSTNFRTDGINVEIFIKGYDMGGMSSGLVSLDFWKKVGLPHLLNRLEQKCKNS